MAIGFGELRKRSIEWGLDLAVVERAYVTDWLLKGIFQGRLASALVLRGGSALRYAYSADYPVVEMPEFLLTEQLDDATLGTALEQAMQTASATSGLAFALAHLAPSSVKIEFSGPLGRRSAAQPHLSLSFIRGEPQLACIHVPLVHPFGDDCTAVVAALSLEELIGERLATLSAAPRARDVFDLWFAVTRLRSVVDWDRARMLANQLAQGQGHPALPIGAIFEPSHRARLEKMWEASLRSVPRHPAFATVENDLAAVLRTLNSLVT